MISWRVGQKGFNPAKCETMLYERLNKVVRGTVNDRPPWECYEQRCTSTDPENGSTVDRVVKVYSMLASSAENRIQELG